MMNPEPVASCTWTKIRLDHHNILYEGKKNLSIKKHTHQEREMN